MAWVSVSPPLSASAASSGSLFCRSPVSVKPQSVPPSRLWSPEVIVAPASEEQFWGVPTEVLPATMVRVTVAVPLLLMWSPPALGPTVELLPVIVLSRMVTLPPVEPSPQFMIPPPFRAVLLEIVLLWTCRTGAGPSVGSKL